MTKVQIICSRPGMMRNGARHEASAFYDQDHWTSKQIDAFKADPAFTVREVDDAAENVLTETDFKLAVQAEVNKQVAGFKADLQARFDTSVREAADEKTIKIKADTDNTIDALGKQLEAEKSKSAALQKQIDDAAAAGGSKADAKK